MPAVGSRGPTSGRTLDHGAMANNRNRRKKRLAEHVPQLPNESPAAEAVTIGWMLSMLTTLGCEVLAIVTRLVLVGMDAAPPAVRALFAILQFAALAMGLISLGLAVAAHKLRNTKPPIPVTVFAVIVGLIPAVALTVEAIIASR